jgi:hypothetical protein
MTNKVQGREDGRFTGLVMTKFLFQEYAFVYSAIVQPELK